MSKWTKDRPVFDRECLLMTASSMKQSWFFNSWWIMKCDNLEDGGWYWGLCDVNGDEWGDINDMSAELYQIIEMPES